MRQPCRPRRCHGVRHDRCLQCCDVTSEQHADRGWCDPFSVNFEQVSISSFYSGFPASNAAQNMLKVDQENLINISPCFNSSAWLKIDNNTHFFARNISLFDSYKSLTITSCIWVIFCRISEKAQKFLCFFHAKLSKTYRPDYSCPCKYFPREQVLNNCALLSSAIRHISCACLDPVWRAQRGGGGWRGRAEEAALLPLRSHRVLGRTDGRFESTKPTQRQRRHSGVSDVTRYK